MRAEAPHHIDGWWGQRNERNKHQHGCACEPKPTVISTAGGDERRDKRNTNTAMRVSRSPPSYRRLVETKGETKEAPTRLCARAEAHRHIDGWWRRKNKQIKYYSTNELHTEWGDGPLDDRRSERVVFNTRSLSLFDMWVLRSVIT